MNSPVKGTRKLARPKSIKLKFGQLDGGKASVLAMPATGGYIGGYRTGQAIATMLLKRMRGDSSELAFLTMQQRVTQFGKAAEKDGVFAALERPISEMTYVTSSRRGQYIGFINTLGAWVAAAAQQMGSSLDLLDEAGLLEQASGGLNCDADAQLDKSGGAA